MSGKLLNREVKSISGTSLTGSLQNFGTVTQIPTYKAAFVNATDVDVSISDGTGQNNFILPASSTLTVGEGLQQSSPNINIQATFKVGTQLQIEATDGSAGTTGRVVATLFGCID